MTDLVQTLLVYSALFLRSLESCVELYLQKVKRKKNLSEQSSQSFPENCHKLTQNTLLGGVKVKVKATVPLNVSVTNKNNITDPKKDTNKVDHACSTFNSTCFVS